MNNSESSRSSTASSLNNESAGAYHGAMSFNNRTISFSGTTISLKNVARVERYNVKRIHKISTMIVLISFFVFLVALSWKNYGFLIASIAGLIAGYGIYERFRPKLYGFLIELNSGTRYYFRSEDLAGIDEVLRNLTIAMENDAPMSIIANFGNGKISINNHTGDNISGDKYEPHNSNVNKMGKFN